MARNQQTVFPPNPFKYVYNLLWQNFLNFAISNKIEYELRKSDFVLGYIIAVLTHVIIMACNSLNLHYFENQENLFVAMDFLLPILTHKIQSRLGCFDEKNKLFICFLYMSF